MADSTALEALLRRDRTIVIASLTGVAALAWTYLVVLANAMASMEKASGWSAFMVLMPMGHWGFLEYALGFAMWVLMMVGMMIPSAGAMIVLHARIARRSQDQGRPLPCTTMFVVGYLLMWSTFSLIAAMVQGVLVNIGLVTETMTSRSAVLAGLVFLAAGLYQCAPMKHACLAYCRSPVWFLSQHWRPGMWGALHLGIKHGAYCVGCCWMLMAALFAVGIMNLAWVAAIATFVLIEKVAPFGVWTTRVAGALFATLGVLTLAQFIAS